MRLGCLRAKWHGMARLGTVQHGTARLGMVRYSTARLGTAWLDAARRGSARHGSVRSVVSIMLFYSWLSIRTGGCTLWIAYSSLTAGGAVFLVQAL